MLEISSEINRNIPLVVLILGPPAVGKSTLAKRLATELDLMILSKDEFKENLFDSLGVADRAWSKRLGGASFDLLFMMIEKNLKAKNSIVIDSDFSSVDRDTSRLDNIFSTQLLKVIQLNLFCEGQVLFDRFVQRSESGIRHRGHVDHENYDEFKNLLLNGRRPFLNLQSEKLEIDMTNLEAVRYEDILEFINKKIRAC